MISTDAFALAGIQQTLWVLLPEFLLILTATAMMTAGAFVRLPRRSWAIASAVAFVAALVALVALRHTTTDPYSAVALNDPLSGYARLTFILTGLILLGLAHDQVDDARAAEFFGSLLLIHAGAMLVAAANEMVFLFAGLELVSIPTYLLLYLPRRNATTQEAATKYFFLSIFSSALLLFGLAYLYGLTGVTNLRALAYLLHHLPPAEYYPTFGLLGVLFVMAGLGFRVAAVPFHFYAPDVYQGSPTVVAALLAWVPKAIGFVAMIRVLTAVVGGVGPIGAQATILAWIIAAATMILGNAVALIQTDLKRLLAYSSIAHAGYLMIGVTAAFRDRIDPDLAFLGGQGILFYLLTYALMTIGAFGIIIALNGPGQPPVETVEDLSGLIWTRPVLATAMAVCLFSLAGVPPLAGFLGKFWIFAAALAADNPEGPPILRWLAILGVLNAAIGAYYYLRIVVVMVFRPATTTASAKALAPVPWPTALAIGTCASLSLLLLPIARPVLSASHASAVAAIRLDDPSLTPQPAPAPAPVAAAAPHVPIR